MRSGEFYKVEAVGSESRGGRLAAASRQPPPAEPPYAVRTAATPRDRPPAEPEAESRRTAAGAGRSLPWQREVQSGAQCVVRGRQSEAAELGHLKRITRGTVPSSLSSHPSLGFSVFFLSFFAVLPSRTLFSFFHFLSARVQVGTTLLPPLVVRCYFTCHCTLCTLGRTGLQHKKINRNDRFVIKISELKHTAPGKRRLSF